MTSEDLPLRYVCQLCSVCLATSEGFVEARNDVVVFRSLQVRADVDKGSKTVICPGCENAVGSRSDQMFLLRKDRVFKRPDRLDVLVCSFKEKEITELATVLREAFPFCTITPRVLQKAELRGFQLLSPQHGPDMVVVVHRNEGRVLLTDRNGFYHDLLGSGWQHTRGNVLVVLTRTAPKSPNSELYDHPLVENLSTKGDQPTVGALAAVGRVLTWETAPSKTQLTQLHSLATKAYYREPSHIVQGIPAPW
eukprot:CAMPEP_0178426414 /NCGR_PEP_ID=MMETSP0689_2-20121128/29222_1 /TAXON_ID=160604 /ORGANISM="Amphidinium massartii, Strain CS-259" /LENGTH=250 /DNA_ID=CAMNT_0020048099 /DNA_START=209 /DNA_END=958 /DNA_ORIENTATION=+